jgi:hypothetical protein
LYLWRSVIFLSVDQGDHCFYIKICGKY